MRTRFAFLKCVIAVCFAAMPIAAFAQKSDPDRLDQASEFLDKAAEVRDSLKEIDGLYDAQAKTLDDEFRAIRLEYDTATLHNSVKFAGNMAALGIDLFQILKARDLDEKIHSGKDYIEHSEHIAEVLASDQTELPGAYRAAMAKYRTNLQTLEQRRSALQAAQRSYNALMQQATNIGLLNPSQSGFAKAPSDIGAWKLQLNGSPRAALPFKDALLEGQGKPAIQSLSLSCGPQNSIAYKIDSATPYTALDIMEGEDSTHIALEADGHLSPKEASRFVAAILKLLVEYDKQKDARQAIDFLLPDMHGDTVNFYGFSRVRSAMKEACTKAVPSTQSAAVAMTPASTGGKELTAWRDIISVVTRLRGTGACNLPPFTPAAIAGLANVNQIPCSHGAGTRLSGMNGIGVFLNSTLANGTARIDNPLDVSVLSSITIQIPSNLYTHVPPANVEAALAGILDPLGYGAYARKAAQALQQGQNGEVYAPHYMKYGFFNGAAVNSGQVYGFTLILRCGPRESPYPYCRR